MDNVPANVGDVTSRIEVVGAVLSAISAEFSSGVLSTISNLAGAFNTAALTRTLESIARATELINDMPPLRSDVDIVKENLVKIREVLSSIETETGFWESIFQGFRNRADNQNISILTDKIELIASTIELLNTFPEPNFESDVISQTMGEIVEVLKDLNAEGTVQEEAMQALVNILQASSIMALSDMTIRLAEVGEILNNFPEPAFKVEELQEKINTLEEGLLLFGDCLSGESSLSQRGGVRGFINDLWNGQDSDSIYRQKAAVENLGVFIGQIVEMAEMLRSFSRDVVAIETENISETLLSINNAIGLFAGSDAILSSSQLQLTHDALTQGTSDLQNVTRDIAYFISSLADIATNLVEIGNKAPYFEGAEEGIRATLETVMELLNQIAADDLVSMENLDGLAENIGLLNQIVGHLDVILLLL